MENKLRDEEVNVLFNVTMGANCVVDTFFKMMDDLSMETIMKGHGINNLVQLQCAINDFDTIILSSIDELGVNEYLELVSNGAGILPDTVNLALAVCSFIKYCTGEFEVENAEELEMMCEPILEYFDDGFIEEMMKFREMVGNLPKVEDLLGCF